MMMLANVKVFKKKGAWKHRYSTKIDLHACTQYFSFCHLCFRGKAAHAFELHPCRGWNSLHVHRLLNNSVLANEQSKMQSCSDHDFDPGSIKKWKLKS